MRMSLPFLAKFSISLLLFGLEFMRINSQKLARCFPAIGMITPPALSPYDILANQPCAG